MKKLICKILGHIASKQYNVGHPLDPYPGCKCLRCGVDMTDWGTDEMAGLLGNISIWNNNNNNKSKGEINPDDLPF